MNLVFASCGIDAVMVPARGDLLDVTVEAWDHCLDINTRGTFFLTQTFDRRPFPFPAECANRSPVDLLSSPYGDNDELIRITFATLACGFAVAGASAQGFPEREFSGIIQWGAGGATDVVSRALAPGAEEALGKKIVLQAGKTSCAARSRCLGG